MSRKDILKNGIRLGIIYGLGLTFRDISRLFTRNHGTIASICINGTSFALAGCIGEKVSEWTDLKIDQILKKVKESEEKNNG